MYGTMFTDMRHFLDEDGNPVDLNPQVDRLYRYFLDIIGGVITEPEGAVVRTGVKCRRRPGRRPCPGVIDAVWEYEDGGQVTWECPKCGDNGHISGIPDSLWDEAGDTLVALAGESVFEGTDGLPGDSGGSAQLMDDQPVFTPQANRIWESLGFGKRVTILNRVHCGNCPRMVAMQLQNGKVEKGDLVLQGRCLECGGEVVRLVEAE